MTTALTHSLLISFLAVVPFNILPFPCFTISMVYRFQSQILKRGGCNGIASLGRLLRIMDDDGDKKLSRSELK